MKRRVNYISLLLDEWGADKHSPRFKACLRRVLSELGPDAHGFLRRHPKLQVAILPKASVDYCAWAYFPVHKQRQIVRYLAMIGVPVRPEVGVLLVISEQLAGRDVCHLRDHLGHVLLYLREPRAKNECEAAMREWECL
jgi:hypothetical protein